MKILRPDPVHLPEEERAALRGSYYAWVERQRARAAHLDDGNFEQAMNLTDHIPAPMVPAPSSCPQVPDASSSQG